MNTKISMASNRGSAASPIGTVLTRSTFSIALMILAASLSISSLAHAADSCQPVFDALNKVASTPNHSYTASTALERGNSAQGETILANGQKYIRVHGRWMRIGVTSHDLLDSEREKEQKGKSTCQIQRRESVNGQPAILYAMQREFGEVKEDAQLWVSVNTGLLLRVESDLENRSVQKKEHQSTHFEYGDIRPPL